MRFLYSLLLVFIKVALGPNLSTNRNMKQLLRPNVRGCHISASMAPRHLKIGRERAYTIVYHTMYLFLSRCNCVGNNMARSRKEAL